VVPHALEKPREKVGNGKGGGGVGPSRTVFHGLRLGKRDEQITEHDPKATS